MREFGVGQSLPRSEDLRLLRGLGRFTDDIRLANQAHLYMLRSPHAAAKIRGIDTAKAKKSPGVIAIFTAADVRADGLGGIGSMISRTRRDGKPNLKAEHPLIAGGRARFVGDPVAAVIAETLAQAKDAAELIEVDYDPLPSVTRTADALSPKAPLVWDEQPDNQCFVAEFGNKANTDAAFAQAAHVAKLDLTINRVAQVTMEPRAVVASFDPADERYTVTGGFQSPHGARSAFANVLRIPENSLRVISPDVGGGFGLKGGPYPDICVAIWASKKVGRPVRWIGERNESFLSDNQARDNVTHVELALDRDGRFLGLRVRNIVNHGAYLAQSGIIPAINHVPQFVGVYTTPNFQIDVTGVFTNTTPTGVYRGAGRPETAYIIERIIDVAARETNIDPAELRRRNLIPEAAMPYKSPLAFTYDSGQFEKNQEEVLKMADWPGFEKRRAEAKKRGKLRGIGIAHVIEQAGSLNDEVAEVRFDPSGAVTVILGTHSHGQSHETTFAQLLVELLGVDPKSIRVKFGDTDTAPFGRGTFGSRSMAVGGAAGKAAAEKIIAKGKLIAGHMLETSDKDIEFVGGSFKVAGTDKAVKIAEVAKASFVAMRMPKGIELGLMEKAYNVTAGITFPNGVHVCEVELDPETGTTEILGYWVMDDVGVMVNPKIVKGQLHGGIAQGVGQALMEDVAYDPESGQNLTGTFMDYALPRALNFCEMEIHSNEVPSRNNSLGIKGAGEAGAVGGLPAAMNAVCDALRPLGIRHFDMPATPQRVWQAIRAANGRGT
jgi:carbon-monoxide dehydrogenase large subunit